MPKGTPDIAKQNKQITKKAKRAARAAASFNMAFWSDLNDYPKSCPEHEITGELVLDAPLMARYGCGCMISGVSGERIYRQRRGKDWFSPLIWGKKRKA